MSALCHDITEETWIRSIHRKCLEVSLNEKDNLPPCPKQVIGPRSTLIPGLTCLDDEFEYVEVIEPVTGKINNTSLMPASRASS